MSKLKPIKVDNEIIKELGGPLDERLILNRKIGKTELSYISGNTCIDILNRVFGLDWSFTIKERWMEPGIPQIVKKNKQYGWGYTVPDMDQVKVMADGTEYYELEQGPVAWCIIEMTVPFKDEETGEKVYVTKSAFGSSAITGNQSTQSTNGYKGAQTDALKKAATLFGVALELYREPVESEVYFTDNREVYTIWTQELKDLYREQWNQIDNFCAEQGYTYDDLAYWVGNATDGQYDSIYYMPEDYIFSLVEILQKEVEA